MKTRWLVGVSVCALAVLAGNQTRAQQAPEASTNAPSPQPQESSQLEEIVVTAQRREQPLQSVPVAVSAFGTQALESKNIRSVTDLDTLVPSLSVNPSTGATLPFLRGIGNAQSQAGNEASNAIYIDDVYYARLPNELFKFNSIDDIEVLKGPQGTLFGRNALGGLISITTREPTSAPTAELSVGYANYATVSTDGYVSIGVVPDLSTNFAFTTSNQGQGWGHDVTDKGSNDWERYYGLRNKWTYTGFEDTTVRLSLDYFHSNGVGLGQSSNTYRGTFQGNPEPPFMQYSPLPGFYNIRNNFPTTALTETWGASLRVRHEFDFADLVSITAYRSGRTIVNGDFDFVPQNYFNAHIPEHYQQESQEFQLVSKKGSSFDWIVGLYYLNSLDGTTPATLSGDEFGPVPIQAELFGKQRTISYAGYAQTTFRLPYDLDFTSGVRLSQDDVTASGRTDIALLGGPVIAPGKTINPGHTYNELSWKFALDHHFTPDILGYVSQSRGYKAGVFNTLPLSPKPVNPEVLDAFEMGAKMELFDHRLRLNPALFYYMDSNPQEQVIVDSQLTLINARAADVKGADLDGEWVVEHNFRISFGAALLDAQFTDFPNAPATANNPLPPYGNTPFFTINADGKYLPRSPKFVSNIGFTYDYNLDEDVLELTANDSYNSGYYWDPDNRVRQNSVNLVDAQLAYTFANDKLTLSVFGKNLSNVKYYANESEEGSTFGNTGSAAAPRTYGVRLTARY